MQSRTKKMIPSKGTNDSNDSLSNMPDHLIVHILSFMSTLDSVKTMLLRRFRNLWTLVPVLKFDFEEYGEVVWPNDKEVSHFEVFSSFARFVRNVLMLHRSPSIDLFHLFIRPFNVRFKDRKKIDDVQMWLRFAIDKQVKDLNFFFDGHDDFALPRCIFSSQSITRLTVTGCVLEHQPHVHMGTLRELTLGNVKGSNEAFNQLISGCPSLRELEIDSADDLHILNITSPNVCKVYLKIGNIAYDSFSLSCPYVKILDIDVSSRDESFMVDAIVSSLQVVNLKGLPSYLSELSPIMAFFTQVQNAEAFTLSRSAFRELCWVRKIDFPQNRWKRLVLRPFWYDDRCLEVILELLKSSVKLEELVVYSNYPFGNQGAYHSTDLCDNSTCVMTLLKKVTVHGHGSFSNVQLQLVELLLENAVTLEKLVIASGKKQLRAVEELNLVKQVVSRFKRASANATVIFT